MLETNTISLTDASINMNIATMLFGRRTKRLKFIEGYEPYDESTPIYLCDDEVHIICSSLSSEKEPTVDRSVIKNIIEASNEPFSRIIVHACLVSIKGGDKPTITLIKEEKRTYEWRSLSPYWELLHLSLKTSEYTFDIIPYAGGNGKVKLILPPTYEEKPMEIVYCDSENKSITVVPQLDGYKVNYDYEKGKSLTFLVPWDFDMKKESLGLDKSEESTFAYNAFSRVMNAMRAFLSEKIDFRDRYLGRRLNYYFGRRPFIINIFEEDDWSNLIPIEIREDASILLSFGSDEEIALLKDLLIKEAETPSLEIETRIAGFFDDLDGRYASISGIRFEIACQAQRHRKSGPSFYYYELAANKGDDDALFFYINKLLYRYIKSHTSLGSNPIPLLRRLIKKRYLKAYLPLADIYRGYEYMNMPRYSTENLTARRSLLIEGAKQGSYECGKEVYYEGLSCDNFPSLTGKGKDKDLPPYGIPTIDGTYYFYVKDEGRAKDVLDYVNENYTDEEKIIFCRAIAYCKKDDDKGSYDEEYYRGVLNGLFPGLSDEGFVEPKYGKKI